MHLLRRAEPNLVFLRVNIDVDEFGVRVEEQHQRGVAAVGHGFGVRRVDRVLEHAVADDPAVDEQLLGIAPR